MELESGREDSGVGIVGSLHRFAIYVECVNLFEKHPFCHRPDRGDAIRIENFELSVEETSLIAGRTILIRSAS
ncbi:MAG: hypothetical protein KDK71_07905 [Chlamydiia bacterium]|nr:hypothetical protein [Chlamydiia bacterium]